MIYHAIHLNRLHSPMMYCGGLLAPPGRVQPARFELAISKPLSFGEIVHASPRLQDEYYRRLQHVNMIHMLPFYRWGCLPKNAFKRQESGKMITGFGTMIGGCCGVSLKHRRDSDMGVVWWVGFTRRPAAR